MCATTTNYRKLLDYRTPNSLCNNNILVLIIIQITSAYFTLDAQRKLFLVRMRVKIKRNSAQARRKCSMRHDATQTSCSIRGTVNTPQGDNLNFI